MIRQRLEINNTATSSYAQREAKDSRIIPLNLCRKISSVSIPNSSWTKVTFFFFCSAIRRCKLSLENPDEVEGENVGTRNLKNIWSERRESFDRSTSRVNVPKRNAQQLNVRYWTRGLETSVDLFQKYRHCVFANEPPRPNNELISSAIVSLTSVKHTSLFRASLKYRRRGRKHATHGLS